VGVRSHRLVFALLALVVSVPALAANIEGSVYRPDGTPVAATVTAYLVESSAAQSQRVQARTPRAALATVKTEEGRFTFANLPESVIDIDVRAEGFGPRVLRAIPNDAPLSITLREAAMVEGRVTANGKPVANAYVVWLGMSDVEYAATTDANGRYRVPDPMKWATEPRVIHPTLTTDQSARHRPDLLHIELQPRAKETAPPPGSGTISGTVRIGKKPLAGVPVMIQPMSDHRIEPIRVVTNGKGRYVVEGLPPRRAFVHIGEGFHPRFRMSHEMEVAAVEGAGPNVAQLDRERSVTVDLELIPAPMISGRVTDVDGKPVAGAQVQVVLAGRSMLDFMHESPARTANDGRYVIAAPPFGDTGRAQVAVGARNRSVVRSKPFEIGGESVTVDVALPRFENVTLRVTAPDGSGVAGARVAFASSEDMSSYRDASILVSPHVEGRALRTDANGTIALQLVRGTYDFAAAAKGFQTKSIAGREIARGGSVQVALEQAFAIRGRVHRNGAGVANVHVSIAPGERMRREQQPVVTGADGSFELDGLARGRYRVLVMKQDEMLNKSIDAEAPSTLDVPLPPAGTLRGRVLDAMTRRPVREFVYVIEPLEATRNERPAFDQMPGMHRAERREDGTFTVTLPAGRYRINAASTGYTQSEPVEVRVTEREPAEIDLLLGRGVTISGRVTDEAGAPVSGANVFATGPEHERMRTSSTLRAGPRNATTGDEGTYTINGLEPGPIQLMVRKEGYVPLRKAIEADGAPSVDVQLTRGLTIEGVVTRGGKPVAEAQISATTPALGGDHQPAVSDANGRFTLRGLVPARYTVAAFKADVHTEIKDVDPTRQRELTISLDPKPTGVIFGTVTGMPSNRAGKIVRRAVFAHSEERGAEATIDDAGNYRIENAPTGMVSISAQVESPNGGRSSARKRVEVTAGQPVRVDLDLAGALTVRGKVSHEGRATGGVRVVFTTDNGLAGSATTREDGAYELALPAPGTYQISAHGETFASRGAQLVREIRGNETIDIELREQTLEGVIVDAQTRAPIAGAFVTLVPELPIGMPSRPARNAMSTEILTGETMTDANGGFRIVTAASGSHRIIASARGYAHRMQPIQLGSARSQQLAFELTKASELRVRVFDAKTNTPLEAHLVIEGLPVRSDRAPDGMTFTFSLAEGKYRVTAVVHGYPSKTVEAIAPGAIDIPM
jgi:protocatechuate 3,4-dioxygenase beta subunit